jgi:hypothetical protein
MIVVCVGSVVVVVGGGGEERRVCRERKRVGGEVKGRMGWWKQIIDLSAGLWRAPGFSASTEEQLPIHSTYPLQLLNPSWSLHLELLYWSKSCPYSCLLIDVVILSALTMKLFLPLRNHVHAVLSEHWC